MSEIKYFLDPGNYRKQDFFKREDIKELPEEEKEKKWKEYKTGIDKFLEFLSEGFGEFLE